MPIWASRLAQLNKTMQQAHVLIYGFVHGVGFRQFVKRKARDFNLCGFVKNIPDGRVEAIFLGKKEKINQMIAICKKGPFLSEVHHLEVVWEKPEQVYSSFEVLKD